MTRIDISYGGEWFTVGDRSPAQLNREIESGLATGHHWLVVNDGAGGGGKAYLSITPGVPLAIVPVPPQPDDEADDETADADAADVDPVWTGPTLDEARRRRHG